MGLNNPDYNYFAEYINEFIKKEDIRDLNNKFFEEKYSNNPELAKKEIKELLMNYWDTHDTSKLEGNRKKTRRENFELAMKQTVLSGEKLTFEDPYSAKKPRYDFSPLYNSYAQLLSKEDITPVIMKGVSPRIKKTLEVFEKEKKEPIFVGGEAFAKIIKEDINPTVLYNTINRQIDNSSRSNNVANLVEIRDHIRDAVLVRENPPLDIIKATKLYSKVENVLSNYYKSKGYWLKTKSDEDLLIGLKIKGVDVSDLTDHNRILRAAKAGGVGLRNYDMGKGELIYNIKKIKDYGDEFLGSKTKSELKELMSTLNKNVIPRKGDFYLRYNDLPSTNAKLESLFNTYNKTLNDDLLSNALDIVNQKYPYLPKSKQDRLINQELAANIINFPVFGKEIEKRFMKYKYGDPSRVVSYDDLNELKGFTLNDFKFKLSLDKKEVVDPLTGIKKVEKNYLPLKAFSVYKKGLRKNLEMVDEQVGKLASTQEEEFIKQGVKDLVSKKGSDLLFTELE